MQTLTTMLRTTAFAVSTLALLAAAPAQALPQEFSAVYAATARDMTVGKAELHLERDGDSYRYSSYMRATGIVGMFVRERISETSSGKLTDDRILPSRYDYRRSSGREDYIRFAAAGGDESLVRYKGKTQEAELPEEALDPLSLQIALMNDVAAGRQTMRYLVAQPRRLEAYSLKVMGAERVDTAAGWVDAIRVDLVGRLKLPLNAEVELAEVDIPPVEDGKSTSFWFVPELDYLVVRIRYFDPEDGALGIDLQNVETLRLSEGAKGRLTAGAAGRL